MPASSTFGAWRSGVLAPCLKKTCTLFNCNPRSPSGEGRQESAFVKSLDWLIALTVHDCLLCINLSRCAHAKYARDPPTDREAVVLKSNPRFIARQYKLIIWKAQNMTRKSCLLRKAAPGWMVVPTIVRLNFLFPRQIKSQMSTA